MLRATSKIQVWILRKQRLVKFWWGHSWGKDSLSQSSIMELVILTRHQHHLFLVKIGEDFAYYLTESEQTPSAVGLNVLLDEEDKVKVAGGFMLQVLPGASEEEIARYEKTHPRDASHFNTFRV